MFSLRGSRGESSSSGTKVSDEWLDSDREVLDCPLVRPPDSRSSACALRDVGVGGVCCNGARESPGLCLGICCNATTISGSARKETLDSPAGDLGLLIERSSSSESEPTANSSGSPGGMLMHCRDSPCLGLGSALGGCPDVLTVDVGLLPSKASLEFELAWNMSELGRKELSPKEGSRFDNLCFLGGSLSPALEFALLALDSKTDPVAGFIFVTC